MPGNIINNKRIVRNTSLLYLRMIIVMTINLCTVRIVLNSLGVEDYGIFNVISGVVSMLSGVTSVLSTATQRYYSFALGENNLRRLQDVFSLSCNIYIIFSIAILLLGETVGLWFINSQLLIPSERIFAANCIYQFSLLSFVFGILQCPYSAATIAHEDMGLFACVNLLECILKFLTALVMSMILFDKMVYYGATLMIIPVISIAIYGFYGHKHYAECHYQKVTEQKLYKELLSFSGWNLFASLAGVGMNQGINILINIFFGPIANAARAIAMQISSAMSSFSSCYITALRPPMIKSYAIGDYDFLNKLFLASNKLVYYSMLIVVVPLYVEMNVIIKLWLNTTDPMIVLFSKLILIYILIIVMNNPISIIMQAAGKVKEYFLPVESMTILCPFACWGFFKAGFSVYYSFYAMIAAAIASHIIRLICLKVYYGKTSIRKYIYGFVMPALLITIVSFVLIDTLHILINNIYVRLFCMLSLNVFSIVLLVYLLGLSKSEKALVKLGVSRLVNDKRI